MRVDWGWFGRRLDCWSRISIQILRIQQDRFEKAASLTTLVAIEDTWHAHQIQGHSKLCICLDIERLISR